MSIKKVKKSRAQEVKRLKGLKKGFCVDGAHGSSV
jgi:hypothetical protein